MKGEEIVIPDPQKGLEIHFKLNYEGMVVAVEVIYENPRPMTFFVNYGALWSHSPVAVGQPRPCGGAKPQEG